MKTSAGRQIDYLMENFEVLRTTVKPLWHPLGFSSCVIRDVPGKQTVRVHYWPEGERRTKTPNWPIHTHTYHLSSEVLSGVIRDIQYEEIPGSDYLVYTVAYRNGDSEISRAGRKISIREVVNIDRQPGEIYSVERGTFHQSWVDFDKAAVTLVTLSDFQKDAPLVLGEDLPDESFPYDRTSFDQERFWSAVQEALSLQSSLSKRFHRGAVKAEPSCPE